MESEIVIVDQKSKIQDKSATIVQKILSDEDMLAFALAMLLVTLFYIIPFIFTGISPLKMMLIATGN